MSDILTGKDWLAQWDSGEAVWSIEMGGIGPGYEQAIQVTVAELLRWFLDHKPENITDDEVWSRVREEIRTAAFQNETIKKLGLSGAQYGVALSLASALYLASPDLQGERLKDRRILVSKNFGMAA